MNEVLAILLTQKVIVLAMALIFTVDTLSMQLLTMSNLQLLVAVFILASLLVPSSEEQLTSGIKVKHNSTAIFEDVCGDNIIAKKHYDNLVSCFPQNDTVLVRKFSCVTPSHKNKSLFVWGKQ